MGLEGVGGLGVGGFGLGASAFGVKSSKGIPYVSQTNDLCLATLKAGPPLVVEFPFEP